MNYSLRNSINSNSPAGTVKYMNYHSGTLITRTITIIGLGLSCTLSKAITARLPVLSNFY